MDLEDTVDELSKETTEISYRLRALEEEVEKLTTDREILEEIKDLKEDVKYILRKMKLAPPSDSEEDDY